MPKFVPRQRKHKVLARLKVQDEGSHATSDPNATEIIPHAKAEVLEEKRRIKEQLKEAGTKISAKKSKRLERYLETKLKKDENRELLKKVAQSTTDTTLFQSSKRLGQGRETKRERLGRALKSSRAGIDIDGDNDDILFEPRTFRNADDSSSDEDDQERPSGSHPLPLTIAPQQPFTAPGTGLKRPLEIDDEGRPVLKKRKRRGGIESKVSLKPKTTEELEWEGFSDESNEDLASSTNSQDGESDIGSSGSIEDESLKESTPDSGTQTGDSEGEDSSSEQESEEDGDDDGESKQGRSSAFKDWANQQLNEALGYQPVSNIAMATETFRPANFQPRPTEEDPLPLELQPTKNLARKSVSVNPTRPPEIQAARLKLPVVAEEQKIMESIHENDLVVIYGATGSGKTTQVPQFLFEAGYGSPNYDNPGMIGVTQPRRVAAVSMSKRVGDELGDHGKKVAYQIRFEGTVEADTAVKFMTDGVLLREVAQDILLKKYSAIIIDEAHERSVNTDILIGMLSRVVKLRKEEAMNDSSIKPLKLIIMSATLRVTDFTENKALFSTPPPVLQAEGRQYQVTMHFARKTHHDYIEEAFRKVNRGHRKLPPGGFLVFLTGQNEITQLSKRLKETFRSGQAPTPAPAQISGEKVPFETEDIDFGNAMDDDIEDNDDEAEILIDDEEFNLGEEETELGPAKMHVLPLYSLLPNKEQLKVFEPPPDGSRLVILATNVAETSLTIPGIRYVFDCGRSKERKYDQTTGVQSFEVGWISKASASQRAGRAGRTGPGHCYRLYSSAVYERDFEEFAEPEILRTPIEGVVLQLKAMNLQKVHNFPFPTPPNRQMLTSSERLLKYLSAITPAGHITPTGATMSIFPLSPRFSRILLVGHLHDCLPYTIALVAGLSAPDFFVPENQAVPTIAPREEDALFTNADHIEEEARNSIRRTFNKTQKDFCFLDDKSDAIKLLQVVGEFAHEPTELWCQSHFVRFKVLREIQQLRRQITDLLRKNVASFSGLTYQEKLDPPTAKQVKALKQMVAAGFIDHIAMRADCSPNPPETRRKPTRAIDVPYLTLFASSTSKNEGPAVYIHPSSPLAHLSPQECPQYVVYSYLQRPQADPSVGKTPRTRMHALTDISGNQIAALAKGTPLIEYGKPIKEVMLKENGGGNQRECWVIPYLRAEGEGGLGWPLPARKIKQKKLPGKGGWSVI